jgi:hypothetical protein
MAFSASKTATSSGIVTSLQVATVFKAKPRCGGSLLWRNP